MKKSVLMIALVLGSTVAFAQKPAKNEVKQLQAFLAQPAEKDGTNAQVLKISDLNSPATWEGVTITNGHVTEINWKDKKLAGNLDLSNFPALTKVDVSRNKITSLNLDGAAALTELNAQRNLLKDLSLDGCKQLSKLNVYKNRLTEIEINETPFLESVNCSGNSPRNGMQEHSYKRW